MTADQALRAHQEEDPELGGFFKALHTFIDRTIVKFFMDSPNLPHPVVSLDKIKGNQRGEYRQKDGYALTHVITIDPFKVATGADAAEVVAHELVHVWQAYIGKPVERNYHSAEFHDRMMLYGILTDGRDGRHMNYLGDIWQEWMDWNSDLQLDKFVLPGTDEDTRRLHKWACPSCDFSFRSRREDVRVVCMTNDCAVDMELVE